MIKKEITICGKQVTLGYCFATEIGYRANADEDIETFITEVVEMFTNQQAVPDRQKCIYLIYASILAYYQSRKEDTPISAEDMMYNMGATEMGLALATILQLRGEFYHVPKGEPKDKPKEGDDKETKNA